LEALNLKKLTSIVLIAMALLFATVVVIAAENATHEVSEKENKTLEQVEKNTSVTQKVTEETKETVTKAEEGATEAGNKAKEEATGKAQPGFEAIFTVVGLLAVALITLNRKH
jgi:PGF-CTERM protein